MTRITLTSDALKKAAKEISIPELSSNTILNAIARAVCGPKKNWGFLKSSPSGHFVQPGLEMWTLNVPGRAPMMLTSLSEAHEVFLKLSQACLNQDEAIKDFMKGRAILKFKDDQTIIVTLERVCHDDTPIIPTTNVRSGSVHSFSVPTHHLSHFIRSGRNVLLCGVVGVGKTYVLKQALSDLSLFKTFFIEPAFELSHDSFLVPNRFEMEAAFSKARESQAKRLVLGELTSPNGLWGLLEAAQRGVNVVATMQAHTPREALNELYGWMPEGEDPFSREFGASSVFDFIVFLDHKNPGTMEVLSPGFSLPTFEATSS